MQYGFDAFDSNREELSYQSVQSMGMKSNLATAAQRDSRL